MFQFILLKKPFKKLRDQSIRAIWNWEYRENVLKAIVKHYQFEVLFFSKPISIASIFMWSMKDHQVLIGNMFSISNCLHLNLTFLRHHLFHSTEHAMKYANTCLWINQIMMCVKWEKPLINFQRSRFRIEFICLKEEEKLRHNAIF